MILMTMLILRGRIVQKRQKTSEYEDMYLESHRLGQVNVEETRFHLSSNTRLMDEISLTIDEAIVIWERVHDFQLEIESYQQKINLTAPTITFPRIEEYDVFSIVYEPVHGIIYTNSKKEKRVMRHSEIHKFCDAILTRTLEGLKSYFN
ncbi:hypothetical protein Tco_1164867 [Tanacetum coccineum]